MGGEDFIGQTFTAPPQTVARLTDAVTRWISPDLAANILEIGCGTGELLCSLAAALPFAQLTGIDLSEPNIELARQKAVELGYSHRLTFVAGDFMRQEGSRYDVIVSASTLHLIDYPTRQLLDKVCANIRASGLLVFTMPDGGIFNQALWLVRRVARRLRGPLMDRLVLTTAKALHGRDFPEPLLVERVRYMYLLPHCSYGARFKRLLRSHCGLEMLAETAEPHVSLGQPKHRLCVYRKVCAS
jgi:2-polyprenyl-3-methyl-5-hydroxy-6-metoxy-1,4-benzoquinol methylase